MKRLQKKLASAWDYLHSFVELTSLSLTLHLRNLDLRAEVTGDLE